MVYIEKPYNIKINTKIIRFYMADGGDGCTILKQGKDRKVWLRIWIL
jgi:KaiC/GvpD/RAD55 family RecA-like ATPase